MLLNPYSQILRVIPGSRLLQDAAALGVVGAVIPDPKKSDRTWQVVSLYAPIGRHLGGIRAKLVDQKGFVTFCNQRDLELLLGLAKPGDLCHWTGNDYPPLNTNDFYGLCADSDDLDDDLFEREVHLRQEYPGVLPYGLELQRRVHLSSGIDIEELNVLLWDCDPDTGWGPDPRLETLRTRWSRVERNKVQWTSL